MTTKGCSSSFYQRGNSKWVAPHSLTTQQWKPGPLLVNTGYCTRDYGVGWPSREITCKGLVSGNQQKRAHQGQWLSWSKGVRPRAT